MNCWIFFPFFVLRCFLDIHYMIEAKTSSISIILFKGDCFSQTNFESRIEFGNHFLALIVVPWTKAATRKQNIISLIHSRHFSASTNKRPWMEILNEILQGPMNYGRNWPMMLSEISHQQKFRLKKSFVHFRGNVPSPVSITFVYYCTVIIYLRIAPQRHCKQSLPPD